MKKRRTIYLIAIAFAGYSIFAIKYSMTGGEAMPGIIAIVSLIGAVGLFLNKSWARYFIYLFTIITVPFWFIYVIWQIWIRGWPYETIGESIIAFLPGVLFCVICIGSSWIVRQYFNNKIIEKT